MFLLVNFESVALGDVIFTRRVATPLAPLRRCPHDGAEGACRGARDALWRDPRKPPRETETPKAGLPTRNILETGLSYVTGLLGRCWIGEEAPLYWLWFLLS